MINVSIYLGIDCGTTSVKVVAFNQLGEEIVKISRANNVNYHDEIAEQSMIELWENVFDALKECIEMLGENKHAIKAIGVTGQGEGLWTLDKQLAPIEPAYLWNDGRASQLVDRLKTEEKIYQQLKLELGSYIKPGSTLTLLKWLKENDQRRFNDTAVIFSCKDWIRFKLTTELFWEMSDATCSNVNLETKEYSTKAYQLLEIEEVTKKLPELIQSNQMSGVLSEELSKKLMISQPIPVSGGMIDIVATAAGQGAVQENDISIILGTTGMTFSVLNSYSPDLEFNGWETHIDKNKFVKGMGTMAATPNLDWLLATLSLDKERVLSEMDDYFINYRPFESGVIYHPHISASGERAPFHNEKATAQFLGINQNTTPEQLIHAVLEGVALSINDCLLRVTNKKKVYVSGGGAKSSAWLQILSDVLGTELIISKGQELAAKGAALSGLFMLNDEVISMETVNSFCQIEAVIKPNLDHHKVYGKIFNLYKETQREMFSFWEQRNQLIERGH